MGEKEQWRILVVDDHPVVRHGLRQLVDTEEGLEVCAEAKDANETLLQITEHAPDLILLDLTLRGMHGLELTKELRSRHPELFILIVSVHDEALYAERALKAGAHGYVMKQAAGGEILRGIREVLAGRTFVSERVRRRMAGRARASGYGGSHGLIDQLSDRELEVFELLGQGYAPRHIAEELCLSVKTIETYRQHLKEKLGLDSAALLTRYAVDWYRSRKST